MISRRLVFEQLRERMEKVPVKYDQLNSMRRVKHQRVKLVGVQHPQPVVQWAAVEFHLNCLGYADIKVSLQREVQPDLSVRSSIVFLFPLSRYER
jgi:hypothetical protein